MSQQPGVLLDHAVKFFQAADECGVVRRNVTAGFLMTLNFEGNCIGSSLQKVV
jgi:hypothetical protein